MSLRHVRAFDQDFDIVVKRVGKKLEVTVSDGKKIIIKKNIKEGDDVKVSFL